MQEKITLTFKDKTTIEVDKGTTYYEVSKEQRANFKNKIIGVKVDNEVISMSDKIYKNANIEFFDVSDINGYKMNQSGLKFVLVVALKETFGKQYEVKFDHSIARGLHMTITSPNPFTKEDTEKLKTSMNELISSNERFFKLNVEKKEAINYFNQTNNQEKAINIHNVTNDIVTVYKLKNYINYFYTAMPYSTGALNQFDVVYLSDNKLVLLYPNNEETNDVPEYIHYETVIKCFQEGKDWLNKMDIPYISDLNNLISECQIDELIKANEVKFDNDIYKIVNDIIEKQAKYIMLAGPSSSGKTTTTKKIALALKARGYDPLVLSVDNYFKNNEDKTYDEDGNVDYESLNSLDLDLLNHDLKALMNKEPVKIPEYNFVLGEKEYKNSEIILGDKAIILMEGLHCINDEMTPLIDNNLKYKIYLSPFLPINIDKHNYVSTVDLRLLRRMVRDNRSRGTDVSETIGYWQSVRNGEEKYIFPYIHNANTILNTALVYELGVLKVYAEPLLYSVKNNSPYYEEARRLINFLRIFFPVSADYVDKDSILREFIGGSSFE